MVTSIRITVLIMIAAIAVLALIMVASITVLGKSQRGSGQVFDGAYFINLAAVDYHTVGGEPPGKWFGAGAAALGLTGTVEAKEFANILAGLRPDGSELEDKGRTKRRKPAMQGLLPKPSSHVSSYDICLSAPKSFSACWASETPEIRKVFEESFDAATKTTLDWFVANVPLVRRGKGGRIQQRAELVIALFDHGTSRQNRKGGWEPQRHRHCIFANIARGEDSRWTAVNSRILHEWTRTLGPMFRATLARELKARLGLALIRPIDSRGERASWFEIAGVPESLCKKWSSRRSEIEELLSGSAGLGNFADAQAREQANLLSRKAKGKIPPREKLFVEWEAVAKEHGLTKDVLANLKDQSLPLDPEEAFQKSWREALERLDSGESTFTYRDAVKCVCEAAQTFGVGGDFLASRTKQELELAQEIRPLGVVKGEERFVTNRMWETEKQLLSEFEKLRSTPGAIVKGSMVAAVLKENSRLLPDQRQAVEQILSGKDSLRILTGVAGAGKSTTLNAIREGLERSGYRVIGGALAGIAKEELSLKANISSRTVASYLHHLEKPTLKKFIDRVRHDAKQLLRAAQGKPTHLPFKIQIDQRTVLVLDEAGMLDSVTLLKLGQIVRERKGTMILVGDTAQLQPILAGGPLAHLVGKESVPHLTTNLRQHDEADRRASDDLREGDAKSALENYQERGRLTIAKDRNEAIRSLIKTWSEAGGVKSPADHVIFTPTRAEAEAANRLAQREREEAGEIHSYKSLRNGEGVICQGDRVLFHKNVFADGIRNGYRGEVLNVDRFRATLVIRLDGQEKREVTVRLQDYGPEGLTLSYAQTTHKAQGQSVQHAYLLVGGGMADREMGYVQATRGRITTQLFVDEAHAGENLEDLARAFSRSRAKELAHDVALRAKPNRDRFTELRQEF
jgi:conjugative relaxase-like TrwC/TraI family protein